MRWSGASKLRHPVGGSESVVQAIQESSRAFTTPMIPEPYSPVTIIALVIVIGMTAGAFWVPWADGSCCGTIFWMDEARSNRGQAVASRHRATREAQSGVSAARN